MKKEVEIKEGLVISINGVSGNVIDVHKLNDCILFRLSVEGYGESQYYKAGNGSISLDTEMHRKDLSGIPVEYYYKYAKDFRFELYGKDMEEQKKAVNDFVLNFKERYLLSGNGLYIYSKEKGTGKTMLACVVGNEIMKRLDKSVKYVTAPDYIEHCREKRGEVIKSYRECSVLILDDLGAESTSKKEEWTKSAIFGLVDWRYKNHLSTIFTSNCPYGSLNEDGRTIDRIASSCVPISIPDVPIRRIQGKKYMEDFKNNASVNDEEKLFK